MREIKFRAWNTKKKCWLADFRIHPQNVGANVLVGGAKGEKWEYLLDTKKHVVLCQFTGLKDKNGKEIYEGDIVKDEYGDFWIIEFGKLPLGKAGDCVCTYQAFYAKALHDGRQSYDCIEPAEWQEVIGNIYENKELLK